MFIAPAWACTGLLRNLNFTGETTLKRIEPHRLFALIVEDVGRYPDTKIGDTHQRVGLEIPRSRVRRAVEQLVNDGKLAQERGCEVAHAIDFPDLAQNHPYLPSVSQGNAPNGSVFRLTRCHTEDFPLVRNPYLSQGRY